MQVAHKLDSSAHIKFETMGSVDISPLRVREPSLSTEVITANLPINASGLTRPIKCQQNLIIVKDSSNFYGDFMSTTR